MKLFQILGLLLCLLFTSCNKETFEWSKFKPIALENSNVDFDVLGDGFLLKTTIPNEEKIISITPAIRYQDSIYRVNYVKIDGEFLPFSGDSGFLELHQTLSGDWGEICYENIQDKNTVNIRLNANNNDTPRLVKIELSAAYEYVVIEITQLGNDKI